jgi:sulfite reductase (NADPH) hemoprotein beta-component
MYRYDEFDERLVRERVLQFASQVERRISGALTEEEFRPLRLKNGLYLQLHAYMLRIAVPYGTLNARQLRQLAQIADVYDRGYGHFTTRQNLQFNWPKLKDVPAILNLLADVEMHCIQTSGNCIRNVTADHFAGVAYDELEDPRPVAELLRQWSSLHPEFDWLGRKFKIAVSGAPHDRAVLKSHDVGVRILRDPATGEIGYQIFAGGGLGRTPMEGRVLREFLPRAKLLAYIEAILRVYNLEGRRDNKYKARIKILVHELGLEAFRQLVEAEFAQIDAPQNDVDGEEFARIKSYFSAPAYETLPDVSRKLEEAQAQDEELARFVEHNLFRHKQKGYTALTISLKKIGQAPGDATSRQMRVIADLAEKYSFDELRVSHMQNIVLPHVRLDDVAEIFATLRAEGQYRTHHRHSELPRPRLLRLGHRPRHPGGAGSGAPFRRSAKAEGDRRHQHQDFRLHQRLRPSSCRQYRHPGAGEKGRRILPDHHWRRRQRKLRAWRTSGAGPAGRICAGSD